MREIRNILHKKICELVGMFTASFLYSEMIIAPERKAHAFATMYTLMSESENVPCWLGTKTCTQNLYS